MKAATSVPDDTFALESTTGLIDAAIDLAGTDESARFAVEAGRRRLVGDDAW